MPSKSLRTCLQQQWLLLLWYIRDTIMPNKSLNGAHATLRRYTKRLIKAPDYVKIHLSQCLHILYFFCPSPILRECVLKHTENGSLSLCFVTEGHGYLSQVSGNASSQMPVLPSRPPCLCPLLNMWLVNQRKQQTVNRGLNVFLNEGLYGKLFKTGVKYAIYCMIWNLS